VFKDAEINYRKGFAEIVLLLKTAKTSSITFESSMSLSNQQVFIRAAVIMMAARLEAFVKQVQDIYSDSISGTWDEQSKGQKRYIALQVANHIKELLKDEELLECRDDKHVLRIKTTISIMNEVLIEPQKHRNLPNRLALSHFYKLHGTKPLEEALFIYRSDSKPFFGWLHTKGYDGNRFRIVLEGLIVERNSIAHGGGDCSLTLSEVRSYLATMTRMVRLITLYLTEPS
jgi:RiboL-PSP-HEPN